jgi:hypothetical protein
LQSGAGMVEETFLTRTRYCLNLNNMEETVKIQIDLPKELSLDIDDYITNLKRHGITKTKAQTIIDIVRIALQSEL